MSAYRLTKKALDDLRSIARYTEKAWGREQRNKYLSKLDSSFQMLHMSHSLDVRAMTSNKAIASIMLGVISSFIA